MTEDALTDALQSLNKPVTNRCHSHAMKTEFKKQIRYYASYLNLLSFLTYQGYDVQFLFDNSIYKDKTF